MVYSISTITMNNQQSIIKDLQNKLKQTDKKWFLHYVEMVSKCQIVNVIDATRTIISSAFEV